ncbi:hypothetical protein GT045_04375 [Streptomyces sp. SID486]|uniref:hypothetical protein n=1 Tax=Streptomyces sp. SID486 TaxID=2690264 RepID=UPI00136E2D91|nr:hypothetical protein [Streptomyces sp. SID486]MYX94064.1 hypothetical protein [Streptomyces sp. SID486]
MGRPGAWAWAWAWRGRGREWDALRDHGDLELVRTAWRRLRADGNGADRQRFVHQRRSSLLDVVDHLITHTTPDQGSA